MLRRNLKKLMLGAAALTFVVVGGVSQASAFWGHSRGGSSGGSYGSSGGSYGSWGSSGGYYGYASSGGSWGSYGGWASSGGSWGGRRHHHRHAYRAAYYSSGGSYGSYGSSGGYYVGWGSSGGSSGGSYGSWGSSGGAVIEQPATMAPTTPPPAPSAQPPAIEGAAPGELPPEAPASGDQTSYYHSATLSVHVPADAKVFVNGLATKSTGAERRYVSSGLLDGYSYTYEVRAELVRDGRPVIETKVIKLQAGGNAAVNFDLNGQEEEVAEQPVSTSLTLHVPADAKVFLSGNETKSFGETRRFSTTKLAAGGEWQDYVVRVELTRDGKTLTKVETVSLKAGDARELTVDFDAPQVAQTNVDRQ
jgi:uncharacterized protein (TIGR03000 family)